MKDNLFFLVRHPIVSMQVKEFQHNVATEKTPPPPGQTIEEFSELPVQDAAKYLETSFMGVQASDWPKSVQDEMQKGGVVHPDGRKPEHRNV